MKESEPSSDTVLMLANNYINIKLEKHFLSVHDGIQIERRRKSNFIINNKSINANNKLIETVQFMKKTSLKLK